MVPYAGAMCLVLVPLALTPLEYLGSQFLIGVDEMMHEAPSTPRIAFAMWLGNPGVTKGPSWDNKVTAKALEN